MKKTYIIVVTLLCLSFLVACSVDMSGDTNNLPETAPLEPAPGSEFTGDVKTFVLTGENFAFSMDGVEAPLLRVNKGDMVIIEFTSTGGLHDWKLDRFNAATAQVNQGESTHIEFVASESGTFEYYCSVGSHRAMGMVGTFLVD